jgi:hypothetical protein
MKKFAITIVVFCAGIALYAQPSEGNPGGAPAPIDGGISLLIAAGAAYGGKRAYDASKKKENEVL